MLQLYPKLRVFFSWRENLVTADRDKISLFEQSWESHKDSELRVQPIPEKMRLEMVIGMQNEIQIGIMKLLL